MNIRKDESGVGGDTYYRVTYGSKGRDYLMDMVDVTGWCHPHIEGKVMG